MDSHLVSFFLSSSFHKIKKKGTYFYLWGHFTCMYACAPYVYTVPTEGGGGHWVPWNWSYKWLSDTMRVLGIEPGSSGRTAHTQNHWAISPALLVYLRTLFWKIWLSELLTSKRAHTHAHTRTHTISILGPWDFQARPFTSSNCHQDVFRQRL